MGSRGEDGDLVVFDLEHARPRGGIVEAVRRGSGRERSSRAAWLRRRGWLALQIAYKAVHNKDIVHIKH